MTINKHDEYCKGVVESLEAYTSGCYFKYNGDIFPLYEHDSNFWDKNKKGTYIDTKNCLDGDIPCCYIIDGNIITKEEAENAIASIEDYFSDDDDIFDIKYTVDANKNYCGVRIMISCGGPNVYIDSNHNRVELYWGDEKGTWWIPNGIVEQIDEYWNERWECLR